MDKQTIKAKHRARKLAVQALYQWNMSGHELSEIEAQFRMANNFDKVDGAYFQRILYGVPTHLAAIESAFVDFLDRPIEQLNPVELAVLRLSAFELMHCPEIPYRVVLDESVVLTKAFGSQDGFRYVNGVLNKMARVVRKVELQLNDE